MILYPGTMLQDRYEILEKIGSGGMSEVYKAKCHKLNRLVAGTCYSGIFNLPQECPHSKAPHN